MFTLQNLKTSRGFTLIELLVVIAIIGILASTVLASLQSARASGRDAQRISELKEIMKALELFRNANNGLYPCTPVAAAAPLNITALVENMIPANADSPAGCADITAYMPNIPTDPTHQGTTFGYRYIISNSSRTDYTLLTRLESNAGWCSINKEIGFSSWNGDPSDGPAPPDELNFPPCF